jgi:hypothetical protein
MTPSRILGTLQAHRTCSRARCTTSPEQACQRRLSSKPHPVRAGYIVWVSADRFEFEHHVSYGRPERAFLFLVQDSEGAPLDVVAWQPQTGASAPGSGAPGAWARRASTSPASPQTPCRSGERLSTGCGRTGQACVLLQPKLAARFLDCAAPLQAEDIPHGHELRQVLTIPAPRIVVAVSSARAA